MENNIPIRKSKSGTITTLKMSQKTRRLQVFLNGRWSFSINPEKAKELDLKEGMVLQGEEIENIKRSEADSQLVERITRWISIRPRSVYETRQYINRVLTKKKLPLTKNDSLIGMLQSHGYLDDNRFAQWWLDNRRSFSSRSLYMIKQEILAKKVNKEIVDSLFAAIEEKKDVDFDNALRLAQKKSRLIEDISTFEGKQKLIQFLLRKGFGYNTANRVYIHLKQSGDLTF